MLNDSLRPRPPRLASKLPGVCRGSLRSPRGSVPPTGPLPASAKWSVPGLTVRWQRVLAVGILVPGLLACGSLGRAQQLSPAQQAAPAQQTPPADPAATTRSASVHTATSTRGMVVSVSPVASQIGRGILRRGGNAVDAAVATALALAVSWPEAGNLGGGGFMMVHPGDGRPVRCIEYREMAPGAASRTLFQPGDGTQTHKIVGVPGTVRGLKLAHQTYGRLPWRQVVLPAVQLAQQGVPVDRFLAGSLNGVLNRPEVRGDPRYAELVRVYGHPQRRAWKAGDLLVLPDLAGSLQRIADHGAEGFYRGAVADKIVAEMQRGDGIITHEDLANYRANDRAPVHVRFRGYDVWGPPPPSSGGICLAMMLNMIDQLKLAHSGWGTTDRHLTETGHTVPAGTGPAGTAPAGTAPAGTAPAGTGQQATEPEGAARLDAVHLVAEVMRRAYCDRARYLGDADFVAVPGERLIGSRHAAERIATIERGRATPSSDLAPELALVPESEETTHFCTADGDGMVVSNTYTLEGSWGSWIVASGTGIVLNNEMGDFNWFPGQTNRQGRIGTLPNQIEPGKRMLSSQTPVLITRDGQALMATGSPGGRTIINTVLGNVLQVLLDGKTLPAAIAAPRMHHQWFPDRLVLEARGGRETVAAELRRRGHQVDFRRSQGSAHSLWIDPQTRVILGVADFRRGGLAAPVDER